MEHHEEGLLDKQRQCMKCASDVISIKSGGLVPFLLPGCYLCQPIALVSPMADLSDCFAN